jgi:hypothetical protein
MEAIIKKLDNIAFFLYARFRLADGDDANHAEKVFQVNAYRLVKEALYEARIQAMCMYYQQILGQKMNKKTGASSIYLREEEYCKVIFQSFPLCLFHLNRY